MNRTRELDPNYDRRRHLERRYGVPLALYDWMLSEQDGVCAICLCPPDPGKVLHVDHDHETGRVRGLLCSACNTGIGCFRDDPSRLASAARYVTAVT